MMFSVRLVLADHYMSPPIHELDVGYSEFRGTEVQQVPVIRIFGSTVTGKKTCLHIHGVFPYMYIPFEGSGAHDRLMYQIASSLDKALNISLGKANATVQHVFKMTLVSGLPFYGFHTKEHQYFKIYFYNPLMVKKAAELLQSGAILNKIYQPHEAHLPYILQFMIDYNLYGMNHVNLKNVKFRRDPENPGSFECLSEEILLPERVSRLSTCETEADAMAADIINRTAVSDQLALNPGLAAIWEDEKQRRRGGGRTSQITPQSSQERPFAASTDSALFFKQKLHEKLLLLNSQLSNNSSTLLDTPEDTKTPYPAETSEDSELLEASFVDLHIQSSGSSPFIRSGQMEQDDNASFVDEDLVLSLLSSQRPATHNSVLMDSLDEELTAVLHNLENSADVDDSSILGSQICQELQDEEIHGCDDEDMQDFSQPLDAVLDCYTDDYYQEGNVKSFTNHHDDSLWEKTFWDDKNEIVPQIDGTDDVLDMPQRKMFGMRGKSFLQKPVPKPSVKKCISANVRSDTSVLASNSEMFCNGVTELNTNEFCLSTGSEDEMCVKQVTTDGKCPVFAGGMKTGYENDTVRNCLFGDGSVTMESIEASQTDPVTTDGSVMDTKSCNDPLDTTDMKIDTEIMLVVAQNVIGPIGVGSMRTLPQDCPSSINDLMTCTSHENGTVTESAIDPDAFVAVPEDCVDPAISAVTKYESLKILSDPLMEVSENIAADGMLVDPDSNPFLFNSLSEVSEDSAIQVMGYVGSESADPKDKQFNNVFGPFLPADESSNSEINVLPLSVICCNISTSDGSAHDLQLNGSRSMYDVDGQDCEQYRQSVLIGDPSLMAQSSLSERDNDFQLNEFLCNRNTSSTWLSSEKCSETSKSTYLSDFSTDLLANYDTEIAKEISAENKNVSCKTSHHSNNSDQKRNPGNYTRLRHSRRTMAQNCKVHYPSCSSKSNGKIGKPFMQCNGGTDSSSEVVVAKQLLNYHVLSKISSDNDTEGRGVSLPTVSTLPSCTYERPMEVSLVEGKQIETILWEGNMEEIIRFKENSGDIGLSPQNEGNNASTVSYIHKTEGEKVNAKIYITGKKSASKEETELFVRDRVDSSAVTTETQNVLSEFFQSGGNSLRFPASPVNAITVNDKKCTGHSNGICLKKLARQLQRKKCKKLSLPCRRKTASLTSKERNRHKTNSIASGELTICNGTETCSTSVGRSHCDNKQNILDRNKRGEESIPKLSSVLKKGISLSISKVKIPELTTLYAEHRDKNISKDLQNNDFCTPLRCRGHAESDLKEKDPVVGIISTVCASDSVENIEDSKVFNVSVRSCNRGGCGMLLTKPGRYKLRSSNIQRQKELTSCHIVPKPTGLVESYFEDETGSFLHNLLNNSPASCLNGYEHSVLSEHLSRHAKPTKKGVQDSNTGLLSITCDIPETVKLVGSMEETKKHGQLKKSYLSINYLEDGSKPNCSVACIKSIVEPDTKFESANKMQFISSVDIHCKEKVQSKEPYENLQRKESHRITLKKRALCNNSLYPNNACIRPCYVKLVKVEDTAKHIRCRPCEIKSHKFSAVYSHRSRDNLGKCSSSKMSGNLYKVSGSQCKCLVDHEGCRILYTNNSDSEAKGKPHKANIQQEDTHYSSSVHEAEEASVVAKSGIKQTCNSVPALGCLLRYRGAQSKINGVLKMSGKKIDAEVTVTSVEKAEFLEVMNKTFHVQEKCDTDFLPIGRRNHLRKIGKNKEPISKKLLNEFSLLNKMRPLSISLKRLNQSVLEKYSVPSSIVSFRSMPHKSANFLQQETMCTSRTVKSYSDAYWKHVTRSGNVKHIQCHDKIPCLDGVFESGSSDDNSESGSVDHFKQLEKSPVTKKARSQERTIHKFENKLTHLQHQDAHYSDNSVLTTLQKQRFGTPMKNLKCMNTASFSQTCSSHRFPKRTLYLPLSIKMQKSPKKRAVDTENKFQEEPSSMSELMKHILVPSKKEENSRLSGEEIKVTGPNHMAAEQNFTNVQIQDQTEDMTCIFEESMKKSSTSLDASQCFPTFHSVAAEVAVTPSSVCHDVRTTEDQHSEKHTFLSLATEQNIVCNEENCQLDILHKLNSSRCESSKSLESDNTSDKSMCSCPVRSEARKDDISQLCACPQRRHGACNKGLNVPTLDCAKNMEQLLAEWSGDTVSKIVRKQPKSPFLGSHIENGLFMSTQENDCKNMSQGSVKVYANGERTSRNSASVVVDFPERKRIVKQRKILDMFVSEDYMHSKALSPTMTVKEGSFLCEGLTEQKLHNSNSLYITQMPEINTYERNETLKTSSLDSDSNGVRNRDTEKVEQHTEDWCNLNDEEEFDEGILSYYNETMSSSATVSAEFQEFMVKPPVPANNSSKHEMNLECALFMRMEQNSLGNVAETHVDVINQTPLTEHLCRNESHFRILTTDDKNFRVYIPRFNPPSKNEILASLSEFCIPEYRHQEPFVGNILDIGNKIEVGSKVLKICSMSVCDLQPFTGSSQDILDIETWRRKLLQELSYTSQGSLDLSRDFGLDNMKPALASNREVVITPCKLPPSVTEVKLWPKAAQKSTMQELQENGVGGDVSSRRIMMPLSPGQESGSDDMSLLPVTPGSLSSERNGRGNVTTTHSTPQVTLASTYLSSPSFTPIHNSSRNRTKMLLKRSREGLKFDPKTQENVSFMLPSIREEPEEAAVDTILKCGAAKENPISSDSSELPHFYDNSGPYKHQDSDGRSEVVGSVEQVQPGNAIDLISSSQDTDEAQPVHKLLLHHEIHPVTTQRNVERVNSSCQIEESTPNNTYGFQVSLQNLHEVKAICEYQFLTVFIMELHIHTRGDLKPDPSYDPMRALFYMVVNDVPEDAGLSKYELAVIVVYDLDRSVKIPLLKNMKENCKVTYVEDEASLVHELVQCVKKWDPDILGGYEVEMLSWGYLFQRAYTLQINLGPLVSRVPTASHQHTGNESATSNFNEEIRLTGRIMLNIWRLMRHEVALQSYTFENVVYHVLHQRIPLHSFKHLTNCWEHRMHLYRWMCVEYYLLRVQGIFKLLDQLDLIGRTSELARLFGIQFLEVLSRGSQFRVESMMLRLAKPINYVPVSPSIQQRARMRAPESLPLIMEPVSRFYSDPVIVLDFQSLYPSIIIAYNYCFSTCLGKVEHLGQATPFVFGCTQLKVPPAHLVKLENSINISPCGVAFVNDGIRKGVLPQMLQEILDTRLMVKQSMKRDRSNKALQRVLHSRQLGLKLIANVTYGYTAANFSGRMPCSEVGDSVVSKARETLERAIHLVEATPRWGAHVVYGDTDSLFVLVPGKSREQAFNVGAEIAEAVTLDNPKPVKLKLEKVYQPCILQTKKRYVGYMYESPDQVKPVYDAKGIETVRRDGCPAVAKILEKSLRLVFETKDVSLVKSYVCRQFTKLLQGRINMQDLIFAREYRGMSGYRPGACVPALELARRWLQTDRRAEPRRSERVPYVIVNGLPGLPLIRLVRSPLDLLADPSLRPNATYYITRVIIPPLDRCFSLLGAEVESWYADMPRKCVTNLPTALPSGLKKCTISQYFITMNCTVCNQPTDSGICLNCQQQTQHVAVVLANKIRMWERTYTNITKVCQSCCGHPEAIDCISLDCPILFRRNQSARDLQQACFIRNLQDQYLTF